MKLKVGCCGLAGLGLTKYAEVFGVTELQSTFYRLPKPETAQRWRGSVPAGFEFTMKAFQGVTHPATSPTWRRSGGQMPKSNLERYGHLQQTEECFKSWAASMDVCARLKAQVCVVQLPPSFDRTDDHAQAVIDFFQKVERRVKVGIEFRHKSWRGDPQPVASILRRVRLLHITDPLVEDPALHSDIQYFRLHGLVSRLYSYTYTDRDLDELNRTVSRLKASECYVMFTT